MRSLRSSLLILLVLLTACGTLKVGIEHTPTPDHAATATPAIVSLPGRLIYESGGDIWTVE